MGWLDDRIGEARRRAEELEVTVGLRAQRAKVADHGHVEVEEHHDPEPPNEHSTAHLDADLRDRALAFEAKHASVLGRAEPSLWDGAKKVLGAASPKALADGVRETLGAARENPVVRTVADALDPQPSARRAAPPAPPAPKQEWPPKLAPASSPSPPASQPITGPAIVPPDQLRSLDAVKKAIREELFLSTLGPFATPAVRAVHERHLAELEALRAAPLNINDGRTWIEKTRALESVERHKLERDLFALGDRSGCSEKDTVENLRARKDRILADRKAAAEDVDYMGLDGMRGNAERLDRYELEQRILATNPGTTLGSVLANASTALGGDLQDARNLGALGNDLEGIAGGAGHALNRGRGAVPEPVRARVSAPPAEKPRAAAPRAAAPNVALIPKVNVPSNVAIREVSRVDDFNAGGTFRTKPMAARYAPDPTTGRLGEDQPGNGMWDGRTVVYHRTAAERSAFRLEVRDYTDPRTGITERRLFDHNGRLFDTRGATTHWSSMASEPRAIFVMNARGEIFASNFQAAGQFHHSSMSGGQPVAAAGELRVVNGRIVDITNMSGHYLPEGSYSDQVIEALKAQDVNLSGVRVIDVAGGPARERVIE